MNYSAIAVRYSKALFSLAQEKNILEQVYEDIKLIHSICQTESEFIRLLGFPTIPASKKVAIFHAIFDGKIKSETFKFLELVAKSKPESYLPAMVQMFLNLYKKKLGIKTVTITSVEKIDDSTRKSISQLIKKHYGADIELVEHKDEKIIGGFILRIEDEQFDASVASQLERIKREFTR